MVSCVKERTQRQKPYEIGHTGLRLYVKVKPNAQKSAILRDKAPSDRLPVHVAAAAHEGEANAELLVFLARHLKVAKSRLSLEKGQTSRLKTLFIEGKENEIETWLKSLGLTQASERGQHGYPH